MDMTELLKFTLDNKASDLHLSGKNPPMVRIDGELASIKTNPLTADEIRAMLFSVMAEEQRSVYERDYEIDFAISFGETARFRINAFTNRIGSAAVFRVIPSVIPRIENMNLPPIITRLTSFEKGLILVTGPTGSGKSTLLAAMVNHINETMAGHILTIEDPVEFFHTSKKSLINHREVGTDTKSFAAALRSALREDPDVILVGEMRDYETISLALTAAETGHLVFGTLHSSDAAKTASRLIDVFPAAEKEMARTMLAGAIQGVISQQLLKKVGGGRVAAHEIMVGTNAVRNLIRENQLPQIYSMIQTGARYGMQTMADSVNDLLAAGLVSEQSAVDAMKKDTSDDTDDIAASAHAPSAPPVTPVTAKKNSPPLAASKAQPPVTAAKPSASSPVKDDPKEGYSF